MSHFIGAEVKVVKRNPQMRSISLSSFEASFQGRRWGKSLICKYLLVGSNNGILVETITFSSFKQLIWTASSWQSMLRWREKRKNEKKKEEVAISGHENRIWMPVQIWKPLRFSSANDVVYSFLATTACNFHAQWLNLLVWERIMQQNCWARFLIACKITQVNKEQVFARFYFIKFGLLTKVLN